MKEYDLFFTQLAQQDLDIAKNFYDNQASNLGNYFIDSIFADLHALKLYAGIHEQHYGYYRMLAKRFPFAIYYEIENQNATVHAILDTRANPSLVAIRLS
ncbi:MAG: type II toxin-antitoxin system RelE/ParE family toxin [Campylobacterales bacterium]|nr:type II toxin-antitoxin system RelE/ParE family toxin [Campylobacterales bacterium]